MALAEARESDHCWSWPRSAITEVAGKPVVRAPEDNDLETARAQARRRRGGQGPGARGPASGRAGVDRGVFTLKRAVLKATFAEED